MPWDNKTGSAGVSTKNRGQKNNHIVILNNRSKFRQSASPRVNLVSNPSGSNESQPLTMKHSPVKPKLAKISSRNPVSKHTKDYVPIYKMDSIVTNCMETLGS